MLGITAVLSPAGKGSSRVALSTNSLSGWKGTVGGCTIHQVALRPGSDLALSLFPSILSPVGKELGSVTVSTSSLSEPKPIFQYGASAQLGFQLGKYLGVSLYPVVNSSAGADLPLSHQVPILCLAEYLLWSVGLNSSAFSSQEQILHAGTTLQSSFRREKDSGGLRYPPGCSLPRNRWCSVTVPTNSFSGREKTLQYHAIN